MIPLIDYRMIPLLQMYLTNTPGVIALIDYRMIPLDDSITPELMN